MPPFVFYPLKTRDFQGRFNAYRSFQNEQLGNLRGDPPRPLLQRLAFTRELVKNGQPAPLALHLVLLVFGELAEPLLDLIQDDVDYGRWLEQEAEQIERQD